MKALPLIFLLFLLVLPLASASNGITIPFNTQFDLKRPCFNNGTFCASASPCNFTFIQADGTTVINNQLMTAQGSFWNYTLINTQTNELGQHRGIMSCCDGTLCGADTFDIEITADGFVNSQFPFQFVIIIFSFVLIGGGLLAERWRLFKSAGSILLMIMGIITFYPGYSFINYSTLLGKALGTVFVCLGFYFLIEDSFSRDKQQDLFEQRPDGEQ